MANTADEQSEVLEARLVDPNSKYVEMQVQDFDFGDRWPDCVTVIKLFANSRKTYIPKIEGSAIITMLPDSDRAIGKCHCSNCQTSIEPWYRYCQECGARLTSKKVIGEDG